MVEVNMALRNQPYIPLYVQDYLTDEKLNSCSASTQGVYIKIMCVLHKQETYGKLILKEKDKVLFKQNDKQNSSRCLFFACKFAKLLPFDNETILNALNELVEENVLIIEGDEIFQKRMVHDEAVSQARSESGKKGGGNPNLFKQNSKHIFKQKDKQNTEYEIENEYENEIVIENEIEVIKKPEKEKDKTFTECKKIWLEFYKTATLLDYNFRAKDAGSLSTLIKQIHFTLKSQETDPTQDNTTKALKTMLDKLPAWYRTKLEISLISSQYNTIVAQIKKDSGNSQVEYFAKKLEESWKK